MKKKIYREKYYKNIEHNGDNYGNKEILKGETEIIPVEDNDEQEENKEEV